MIPATALAALDRQLAAHGQTVTLRRQTIVNPVTYREVTVTAVVRKYRPEELAGTIVQGDRQVIMSDSEIAADGWPGPPQVNDRVVIDGATATVVKAVDTIKVGATTVRHNLTVTG